MQNKAPPLWKAAGGQAGSVCRRVRLTSTLPKNGASLFAHRLAVDRHKLTQFPVGFWRPPAISTAKTAGRASKPTTKAATTRKEVAQSLDADSDIARTV